MKSKNMILLRAFFIMLFLGQMLFSNKARAHHACNIVNPTLGISGGSVIINGTSSDSTCTGEDSPITYMMEAEIRCNSVPFTGVANANSATMSKPYCVFQAYPSIVIPLSNLCPGVTYKWRVRERLFNTTSSVPIGSWSSTFTFTTPGTSAIVPNLTASVTSICPGQAVQLSTAPTGACQNPVAYSWSHGLGTGTSATVNPTVTTTYTVTITDACGVTGTQSITINIPSPPVAGTASLSPVPVCPGGCVTLTLTGSSAGNPGHTVQWQKRIPPGSWQNITGATNTSYQYCPVTVTTYFRAIVSAPCYPSVISNTVIATLGAVPSAQITGQPGNDCNSSITVPYTAPGQANVTYSWAVTGGTPASGTGNSINVAWGTSGGSITLTATNTVTGCTDTSTLQIAPCCQMTYHPYYINNIKASDIINDPLLPGNYLTYNNGVYQLSHHYIVINGVFTVDIPFELVPPAWNPSAIGDVFLGGNAQIQIDPGITFKIDRHALKPCTYMWDGIYINGTTSSLVTTNGTSMQGAKNAVVSVNGGHFDLSNTTFFDNYSCVKVNAYAGNHTGTIRTCTFTTSGNSFTPSLPPASFPVTRTLRGVEVHNVGAITIGDASNIAFKNIFDNVMWGIWSDVSNTTVHNNTFRQTNPSFSANTFGIVAHASKMSPRTLTVGGLNANETNEFSNNWKAIYAYNYVGLTVLNNAINNSTHTGIEAFQCKNQNILIEQNRMETFVRGIVCTDNLMASVTIKNNDLNMLLATTPSQTGISVQNPLAHKMDLTISQNDIKLCRTGIWAVNAQAMSASATPPRIVYNNIDYNNFTTASITAPHYGIRAQYVLGVTIENNAVARNITPVAGIASLLFGIEVENCMLPQVSYNTLTRLGTGIEMNSFVLASKITCNEFMVNYYGINFNNSLMLGDQYMGLPNDNEYWGASVIDDLNGVISPIIQWYSRSGYPYAATGNPIGWNGNTNNGNTACGPINPPPAQVREHELGSIIRNENEYEANADVIRYWERDAAYWRLFSNDSLLWLGEQDDADYEEFFNTEKVTNIGLFHDMVASLENDDVEGAITMNESMAPVNDMEEYSKTVNEVYLYTWAQGYAELDTLQQQALESVAYSDPLIGGKAVYTARVMTGIDPGQGEARMQAPAADATAAGSSSSSIYPNPNSGKMSMEYELAEGRKGELIIYSLQGVKVGSYTLEQDKHKLEIDASGLNSGVYLYKLLIDGSVRRAEKLIIIK